MVQASQPDTDSSTRPYTEMELFVRDRRAGERDYRIAYRMGPNASTGVAEVYGSNVGISPDVARALAHLMAAAPKLLKALRKIHQRAEDCHLGREVVESDSFHFHEIMVEAAAAIEAAKS